MNTTEPTLYYQGIVGGKECYISSNIWQFGAHTIPTFAISDVYAMKSKSKLGIIVSALVSIVFLLLSIIDDYMLEVYLPIMLAGIIVLILFYNNPRRKIVVFSRSNNQVVLSFKNDGFDKAQLLYEAMLKCLDEGNDSHIISSVFQVFDTQKQIIETNVCLEIDKTVPDDSEAYSSGYNDVEGDSASTTTSFKTGDTAIYEPLNVKIKILDVKKTEVLCSMVNSRGVQVGEVFSSKITDLVKE